MLTVWLVCNDMIPVLDFLDLVEITCLHVCIDSVSSQCVLIVLSYQSVCAHSTVVPVSVCS